MESGTIRKDELRGTWGYSINAIGAAGKRRQYKRRGFRTKGDATAALDAFRTELRRGPVPLKTNDTLRSYIEPWLDSIRARNREQRTVASARTDIERLLPTIGDIRLQALTADDLNRAYAALEERGLSANTRRKSHVAVKAMLKYAMKRRILSVNVADDAEPPDAATAQAREFATWRYSELTRFLAAVAGDEFAALWHVAAWSGMRQGELAALHWSDVDLDKAEITVRGAFSQGTSRVPDLQTVGTGYYHKPTKSKNVRVVRLDGTTVQVLTRHRARQVEQRLAADVEWKDLDLVFCDATAGGVMVPPYLISRLWGALVTEHAPPLGLSVIRFHDLRHSHATILLAAGSRPDVVSKRLGHRSVAFTLDTYGHVYADDQSAALDLVFR